MFDAGKACFSVLFAFYVNWIGVPVYFTNYGYLVNEKIINIKTYSRIHVPYYFTISTKNSSSFIKRNTEIYNK